jgi:hypothetical protein
MDVVFEVIGASIYMLQTAYRRRATCLALTQGMPGAAPACAGCPTSKRDRWSIAVISVLFLNARAVRVGIPDRIGALLPALSTEP